MLSKRAFVKGIEDVRKIRKLEDGINDAFSPYEDCEISIFSFEESIVELLEDGMEDASGNIAFWIYDLEMGTLSPNGKTSYTEIDTEKYNDINDSGDLYDYLVEIQPQERR